MLGAIPQKEMIKFPAEFVHPDHLKNDTEYVVMIRSISSGEIKFVGPFRPAAKIVPLNKNPFMGNFQLKGILSKNKEECRVLIPKDGNANISRMQYSLHLYTPSLMEFMGYIINIQGSWIRSVRGGDH